MFQRVVGTTPEATTKVALPKEAAPGIFITEELIKASEIVVPSGYRLATMEEVALWYKRDSRFRTELDKGRVWVSPTDFKISNTEFFKINDDGSFVGITEEEYKNTEANSKVNLRWGKGYLHMGIGHYSAGDTLEVWDDNASMHWIARVALVKER